MQNANCKFVVCGASCLTINLNLNLAFAMMTSYALVCPPSFWACCPSSGFGGAGGGSAMGGSGWYCERSTPASPWPGDGAAAGGLFRAGEEDHGP